MADANKTEKPTPRRRQKAREKGQVARTRDLASVLSVIAVFGVVAWQSSSLVQEWRGFLSSSLDLSINDAITPNSAVLFMARGEVLRWILPAMLGAWVISMAASVVQGGFVFAPEALAPSGDRLNPANKLQQLFSISSLSGLLKSLPPIICVLYIAVGAFREHWAQVVQASNLPLASVAHLTLSLAFEIGWKSIVVLLILAAVDYFINWRKHESDLKMSREELREELKETDGNPAIKSRIRRIQRQVRRQQMLKAAETATVVVTNPTHFAVALQYKPEMKAPLVVAKGQDRLAQEIKEVARWNNIPLMENPPLAQALYRLVPVGHEIPAKLYTAVAEILALVYRAQAQARQRRNPDPRRN